MMSRQIQAVSLSLVFVTLSCSPSTTHIYTRPAGAEIVMDDKFALGQSPIQLSEPVWIWTRHRLSFSKPGYKTRVIEIENTGINPGGALVCVCTAGILLPLFFRSAYLPQYSVELAPEEQATAPIQLQQRFSFQESFHAPNYR